MMRGSGMREIEGAWRLSTQAAAGVKVDMHFLLLGCALRTPD
jgi:hypothetical protein